MSAAITLNPIGVARNGEGKHFGGWAGVVTRLELAPAFQSALDGLAGYSHLVVVFWMHGVNTCELKHVPQGKAGVPEVGIFACRCVQRPNPIGVSTVRLLDVRDGVVTVQGLDVIDGTPILDLKPYTPQYDAAPDATVPEWVGKLDY